MLVQFGIFSDYGFSNGNFTTTMRDNIETEDLVFLKEGWVADKLFFIFQNSFGEMRAVEASKVNLTSLSPGDKLQASIRRKGCSGREIERIYPL